MFYTHNIVKIMAPFGGKFNYLLDEHNLQWSFFKPLNQQNLMHPHFTEVFPNMPDSKEIIFNVNCSEYINFIQGGGG